MKRRTLLGWLAWLPVAFGIRKTSEQTIEVGQRVRILRGDSAGKVGIVDNIQGKFAVVEGEDVLANVLLKDLVSV